jgi:hypothetical protein
MGHSSTGSCVDAPIRDRISLVLWQHAAERVVAFLLEDRLDLPDQGHQPGLVRTTDVVEGLPDLVVKDVQFTLVNSMAWVPPLVRSIFRASPGLRPV